MNKAEIVTVEDLNDFREKIKNDIQGIIQSKINPLREFYTPKEFSLKTGMKYSTIVYKCNNGKIKAVQEAPNCTWLIHSSELERMTNEAEKNVTGAL